MNVSGFLETLPIVLYGMTGIFIVIGVIFLSVKILMAKKSNPDNQNET